MRLCVCVDLSFDLKKSAQKTSKTPVRTSDGDSGHARTHTPGRDGDDFWTVKGKGKHPPPRKRDEMVMVMVMAATLTRATTACPSVKRSDVLRMVWEVWKGMGREEW